MEGGGDLNLKWGKKQKSWGNILPWKGKGVTPPFPKEKRIFVSFGDHAYGDERVEGNSSQEEIGETGHA